jgi:hypothetical protein
MQYELSIIGHLDDETISKLRPLEPIQALGSQVFITSAAKATELRGAISRVHALGLPSGQREAPTNAALTRLANRNSPTSSQGHRCETTGPANGCTAPLDVRRASLP